METIDKMETISKTGTAGKIDFDREVRYLEKAGVRLMPDTVRVAVPDARNVLFRGLRHFVGDGAQWLPEYDEVADWLSDNKGRGLLCYGNCGRGKTLICTRVIPPLLSFYHGKLISLYDAMEMNGKPDEVLAKHLLCVDDIGVEGECVIYGARRQLLAEIVDAAEKKGKLLVLTTNLSLNGLASRYGERTMDRLVAVTRRVNFKGGSLRS